MTLPIAMPTSPRRFRFGVHFGKWCRKWGLGVLSLGIGIIGFSGTALAQAGTVGEAVAATVNDEMISTFDVRQRVRLMVLMSGNRIPESAFPQLQEQALKDLVEEKLKLQEAERLEFEIDPADIEDELTRLAASSGLTMEDLVAELEKQGIAIETLADKFKADLTWQRIVSGRFGPRVRVTDQQIETVHDRLREDSRKEQYLVSEICLPVEDEARVQEIYRAGLQMIEQMRKGVPFDAVARQFSVCATAANGGDLGWVHSGELAPELDRVLQNLEPGAVSVPTPFEGNLYILAMRDKRGAGDKKGEPSYTVTYAGAPLTIGEEAARKAFNKLPLTNACESNSLAIDLGPNIGVTSLPALKESQFEEPFREELAKLGRGEVSKPIAYDGAYHAVLMCEKDEGLGLPSRKQIADRLYSTQLTLLSRRYLRDVERNSSVDIRIDLAETKTALAE